jgi:hypothetical protein
MKLINTHCDCKNPNCTSGGWLIKEVGVDALSLSVI